MGLTYPVEDRVWNHVSKVIQARFENGPEEDRLSYHDRKHTRGVIERAVRIADAMGLSRRKRILTAIAAGFHDIVQDWEPLTLETGAIFRKRKTSANEQASAEEAVEWMINQDDMAFTETEWHLVRSAILVTVPSWNQEHSTVVQSALLPDSHPVVRAVALADLGSAGMDPDTFKDEGVKLFLEQEIDISEAIRIARVPEKDITDMNQVWYLERHRLWMTSQVSFARGRQALFETELGNLTDLQKEALRQLFSHFPYAITVAEVNVLRATEWFISGNVSPLTSAFLRY